MPANGNRFLIFQAHEPLNQKHRFFAMPIWEFIVNRINRHFFPFPAVVFPVAVLGRVEAGLADIVQQGRDGKALQIVLVRIVVLGDEHIVNVQAVLQKAALIRRMKAGGCGRDKKVGRFEPFEQFIRPAAGHLVAENL